MTGPELLGVIAVIAIVGAVFFLKPKRGGSPVASFSRPTNVIDAYDASGREAANKYVEEALGKFRAQRFAEDISKALGVIERPAPSAPPTPPATPPNA